MQGRLVEVLSGMSFEAYVRNHILDPLKMSHTHFSLSDEEMAKLGPIYQPSPEHSGIRPMPTPPGFEIFFSPERKLMSGGGGLASTLGDYLRFTQMLVNSGELQGVRILGPKIVDLMMMDHVPVNTGPRPAGIDGYGFGLGGAVLRNVAHSQLPGSVGEYTWGGAAGTLFWVDRKESLGVVLMTQIMPGDSYALRKESKALVYQAIIK